MIYYIKQKQKTTLTYFYVLFYVIQVAKLKYTNNEVLFFQKLQQIIIHKRRKFIKKNQYENITSYLLKINKQQN